jgi:diaminopimelate decarboxylase
MFDTTLLNKMKGLETPFYFYDLALLQHTVAVAQQTAQAFHYHIHYALKANANPRILRVMREAGLGADCVSANEVLRAVEAGFPTDQIVFAGVGKSDKEIAKALRHDIFCFNCESVEELAVLNGLAAQVGKVAPVALRINPSVEVVNTHKYITTGTSENKFGIPPRDFAALIGLLPSLAHVRVVGLHSHIGSQIRDLDNFKHTCLKFNEIRRWFEHQGVTFSDLNLGGGLGVNYQDPEGDPLADFAGYFRTIHQYLEVQPGQQVHFELGRALVAQCGSLFTQVLYTKQGEAKHFAIVDAGMTELIRPALYQAYHKIENVSAASGETQLYDVVGPVCESSDFFGKDVALPLTRRGDLLAVRTAGAYGEVMTSYYNLRDKAAVYYSDEL